MRNRWTVWTLIAVLAMGTAEGFAQNKTRIAVLPFKNKGGKEKYAWLSEGFATTLTEGLQQIQAIYVADRNQVNSVVKKGQYTNDDLFTSKAAYEIGSTLGLDYVIIGAFNIKKDTIDCFAIVVDGKKKGEYIKTCSPNTVKPLGHLWQVYDKLIDAVCKTECFNVTITANEQKQIKAITNNTENFSAYEYYIKGRKEHLTYSVKGYENAIGFYDKALELDPSFALALGAKGEAQAFWGYQKELNAEPYKDMYDAAYANVQRALGIAPNIGSIHRNMATTYQMLRRFTDANAEAKKAVDLNANDAEGWYQLWRSYSTDVNAEEIKRSLEISPYLPVANLTLGNSYMDAKDYVKAEEYYKRALIGNDEYELAQSNLGNLYVTLQRWDEAEFHLKRSLEIKPRYAFAWYTLGLVYWNQTRWADVVNAWEKCLEVDPNHSLALQWLPKAKENLQASQEQK
jgi:tetratricopeptide (TPR) repeat protein